MYVEQTKAVKCFSKLNFCILGLLYINMYVNLLYFSHGLCTHKYSGKYFCGGDLWIYFFYYAIKILEMRKTLTIIQLLLLLFFRFAFSPHCLAVDVVLLAFKLSHFFYHFIFVRFMTLPTTTATTKIRTRSNVPNLIFLSKIKCRPLCYAYK